MKLANEQIERHSIGVKNSFAFTVATNAKMMRLLSDSLYSDKVLAPVRELSTNALDSHIAAGIKHKPFYVHLPNATDPQFKIRDYGTGLDYEGLTKLYTTYGESSRNESNDFVGAMGLGSKSPLAYTDSFTVTSYHNGKKYVCICGRDKSGVPTLNIMDKGTTNEANGLEVSFAVKRDDFTKFEQSARKIYKTFPVVPRVDGLVGNLTIEEKEVILQGTGWRLYKYPGNTSVAIMGYIEYPIETKYFSKYHKDGDAWYSRYATDDNSEVNLLNLGLEIHFPIGEVEMDISRERLQYNPATINAIKARLATIKKEIEVLVLESFKNCKTVWEARCLFSELCVDKLRNFKDIAKSVDLVWKGHDLTKNISLVNSEHLDVVSVHSGYAQTRRRYEELIVRNKSTKFYVNDVASGAYAVARRDSQVDNCYIYVITFKGTDAEQAAEKQKVIDKLGIDSSQLIYVSSLPKVTRDGSTNRKTKQFILKTVNNRYRRLQSDWWEEKLVDLSAGGLYVELDGFTLKNSISCGSMIDAIEHLKALGIVVGDVCGLRPSHVAKIKDNPKWIDFKTYIETKIAEYANTHSYVTLVDELTDFDQIAYMELAYHAMEAHVPPTSQLGKFIAEFNRVEKIKKKLSSQISSLTSLSKLVQYKLPTKDGYKFHQEWEAIKKTYPLFEYVFSRYMDDDKAKLVGDYVKLINK